MNYLKSLMRESQKSKQVKINIITWWYKDIFSVTRGIRDVLFCFCFCLRRKNHHFRFIQIHSSVWLCIFIAWPYFFLILVLRRVVIRLKAPELTWRFKLFCFTQLPGPVMLRLAVLSLVKLCSVSSYVAGPSPAI